MPPHIISIDGNIGSGKSTLVKILQTHFRGEIVFVKEPVDEWETICDTDGVSILQKFYQDQSKYAFSFQMMAYISRLTALRSAIKEHPNAIIVTERSVLTDRNVFAKMLYDNKKIEDVNYAIYLKWFDEFIQDIPIQGIVYIKTNPHVCYRRIQLRNRTGEEGVPIEYLQSCSDYHDKWLNACTQRVISLDGNIDLHEQPDILKTWIKEITQFINHDLKPTQSQLLLSYDTSKPFDTYIQSIQ